MNATIGLLATVVLLLLNAVFVAAEFALVSARRASIEPRAEAGSRRAAVTLRAMEQVSIMLAGAQLGITLCSVALGAVSEPAIAHLLQRPFEAVGLPGGAAHAAAFVIALLLITVLHVVLGEMVPKNIALAAPEASSLWLSPVLAGAVRVVRPLLWLLNGLANLSLRVVRVQQRDEVASAFTSEEVADMVDESHRGGLIAAADRHLLGGALAFDTATAADLTLPLARVHTLDPAATPAAVEAMAARTGVTRFPLLEGERLIGYVHVKDTLPLPADRRDDPLPASCIRALPDVAAAAPLADAIEVMRNDHAHLARVFDGAALRGVITLDDILASLVQPSDPAPAPEADSAA